MEEPIIKTFVLTLAPVTSGSGDSNSVTENLDGVSHKVLMQEEFPKVMSIQ